MSISTLANAPARRRQVIAWGFIGGLAFLSGCALHVPAGSSAGAVRQVAAGVYVLQGSGGFATRHNAARVGNVGFVVGPDGVVVVDSGGSHAHGRAALAAIAAVTSAPIRVVILTHPSQEFLFGASAFQERGIPVWMHRDAARLMAARCGQCLENLRREVGAAAMAASRVPTPDVLIDGARRIEAIGRPLQLLAPGWSSAPGALALLDQQTATLLAGDLVALQRVPDLRDADLDGWRSALQALGDSGCQRVVPGRGAAGRCDQIIALDRYLAALDAHVTRLLREGVSLAELPGRSELPGFAGWEDYERFHRANAQRVYLKRERELFE